MARTCSCLVRRSQRQPSIPNLLLTGLGGELPLVGAVNVQEADDEDGAPGTADAEASEDPESEFAVLDRALARAVRRPRYSWGTDDEPEPDPTGRGHSYRRPEGRGRGRGQRRLPQWHGSLRPEYSSASWFPTHVEEAFAASVRLPHGTSLLVDTGAPGNLAGSEWTADHSRELWSADLPAPHYVKRDQPLACSGVGKGKQEAWYDIEVPIALGSGRLDAFHASELPDSATPALLGRLAMKKKRVLLDTFNGKFVMVGPGGYELKLSPGSEIYDTEDSRAGHMMLPCSQFNDVSRQQSNQEVQTFLVGDYFAPHGSSAALQRLPDSDATFDSTTDMTTHDFLKPPPGAAPLANRRRRERNFATMAGHDSSS